MTELVEPFEKEKEPGGGEDHLRLGAASRKIEETIFILVGNYIPGFKGGGPTRSIANQVSALGQEFRFKIITLDRDLGDTLPYPSVAGNRWVRIGDADVMYVSPGWRGFLRMIVLLRSMDQSAVLYLNGFFPRRFSMLAIFLQRLGLIHPGCLVLAPRGEFSPGALQIKKTRKMLYIVLSRLLGLYRGVIWHASTELERADVLECFRRAVISIAGVIPQTRESQERLTRSVALPRRDIGEQPGTTERTRPQKISGHLCIVFVSRISPMKNLLTALRILQGVSGDVAFDIYGPAEDAGYWNKCKTVIGTLPANVRVQYIGEVEHDRVSDVFAEYDLFLFPTLGENYGHVIYESLAAGCPVLISDRTPWRELQDAGVGWDIPIDDTERFTTILQQCVDADDESYAAFRARAKEYAERFVANPEVVEANRKLFKNAVAAATE